MEKYFIGADIGGSHITCQLVHSSLRYAIGNTKVRKDVDCNASSDAILAVWAEAIREAAGENGLENLAGIGFAMPGPFDYPNGVAWFRDVEKFDDLYGVNVREEMVTRLDLPDGCEVRFLNDAACFAIGESLQGSGAGHERLLAITLGTGFGTTFIRNHIPVAGEYGIPGDGFLYRVPFRDSVADEYFSTRWFLAEYERICGLRVPGVRELAGKAGTDPVVAGFFNTFGSNLGEFIAPWLKGFDAGCLVIGGSISAAYPLFSSNLDSELSKADVQVPVYISTLQEDAALWGSAGLCDNELYSKLIK
jgi:glucokinase